MHFEILITKDFLKKSYSRRLLRNWWKLGIAFCLIFCAILLDFMSEEVGRISTIGLTVMCICILVYSAIWYKQLRFINDFLARQGETPVKYRLTTETIEAESLLGESKLKWHAFRRLRIRDLDTLLELPYAGALTLPTNQLNREILEFLQDRFSAHGIQISTKIKGVELAAMADRR